MLHQGKKSLVQQEKEEKKETSHNNVSVVLAAEHALAPGPELLGRVEQLHVEKGLVRLVDRVGVHSDHRSRRHGHKDHSIVALGNEAGHACVPRHLGRMGTGFDLDTATALASDPGRLGKVSVFVTNSTTGGDRNDLVAVGRFVQQILGVRGVTANEHVAGKVDNTRITNGAGGPTAVVVGNPVSVKPEKSQT